MYKRLISNLNFSAEVTESDFTWPSSVAISSKYIWVALYSANLVNVYSRKCLSLKHSFSVINPTGIAINCKKTAMVSSANGSIYLLECSTSILTGASTPSKALIDIGSELNGIAICGNIIAVTSTKSFTVYLYTYDGSTATVLKPIVDTTLKAFGFSPIALTFCERKLYILYSDLSHTIGNGYVNVVTMDKKCKKVELLRLICQDNLSDPSSITCKDDCLYIGNVLTGTISIFNRECGEYISNLTNEKGADLIFGSPTSMTVCDDRLYLTSSLQSRKIGNLFEIRLNR